MKRIFIGIAISEAARSAAASHVENLRREYPKLRVSWVRPENFHITMKFIGETDLKTIKMLTSAISEHLHSVERFHLRYEKNAVFGRKTLVITLENNVPGLEAIKNIAEEVCEKLGIAHESRKFHPHLTLARIRSLKGAAPLLARHLQSKIPPVEFEVDRILLFESRLAQTGSIYTKLDEFQLH